MKLALIILTLLLTISCASAVNVEELTDGNLSETYIVDQNVTEQVYTTADEGIQVPVEANPSAFKVTVDTDVVAVSMDDAIEPDDTHTVAIPDSALSVPETGLLLVKHYTEDGVNDWDKVEQPVIENGYVYVDAQFSTILVTGYPSSVLNWNMESWLNGTSNVAPDNWTKNPTGNTGINRSTEAKIGSYSMHITGDGSAVIGSIHQDCGINGPSFTPGNYTVGAWIKVTGCTNGRINLDITEGTPVVDSHGATFQSTNTDWRWIEYTEYINSTNPILRIFVDGSPNAGSQWYVDGVVLAPTTSYNATEYDNGNGHLFQNFTYGFVTPRTGGFTYATGFEAYDLRNYNIASVTASINGTVRPCYYDRNYSQVIVNLDGVTPSSYNFVIDVVYNEQGFNGFTHTLTGNTPTVNAQFYAGSANSPTSWLWNFGDGTTSTEQNPTHVYSTPNVYTVTLTATNETGSSATYTQHLPITPRNYAGYKDILFTHGMSGWDLIPNMANLWAQWIPLYILAFLVLYGVPVFTGWIRQGRVVMVCAYFICAFIIASQFVSNGYIPAAFMKVIALSLAASVFGLVYRMFVTGSEY